LAIIISFDLCVKVLRIQNYSFFTPCGREFCNILGMQLIYV